MEVAPESVVIGRLTHSLMQLVLLIPHTDDPSIPLEVSIACVESWALNQRLIVEFLLLKPPKNCATASRVLESWDKSSVGSQEALKADYGWASQYVAHIAEPKPGELDRNMHPVAMIMKTDLVIDAVEQFAEQLEHAGHELAGLLRTGVAAARSELGSLRRYRS